MRRVQSSLHGACAAATVVLGPASSITDCGRLSRHRSSLVFTPCASETPTRCNSQIKIQRAVSSFSSASGWDGLPAGDDDVVHGAAKGALQDDRSPLHSAEGIENQRCSDDTENRADESVSCFVTTSAGNGAFTELSTSCQPAIRACKSCASAYHHRVEFFAGDVDGDDRARGNARSEGEWLGAVLAGPSPRVTSLSSPRNVDDVMSAEPDLWQQSGQITTVVVSVTNVGSTGDVWTRRGLHRTRRVVREMDRLAEVEEGFDACYRF